MAAPSIPPPRHRRLLSAAFVFTACLLTAILLAGSATATGVLESFRRPLEPPGTGGVERVDRALAKLTGHRRALVIGAHPDDEDTTVLALVARGLGGEAAYLSLSRGEGGQNLIGSELGPGLGLLRSRELLAARELDGARQFFARAYDFGYTRSLPETLAFWPREVLLEDTVRVIRRFRPQVIVSVFPPDPRAGHGQHQVAGLVAGQAYALAGDPGAFSHLAAAGLPPWTPQALYRNTWWRGRDETTLLEPAGVVDPLTGRSVFQIAMGSRSRHRSQDMGMLQPLGPRDARLAWEDGGAGPQGDHLFAGIDTTLPALADGLPPGQVRDGVQRRLARVAELALATRADLAPARLAAAVPPLAEMVTLLREARGLVPEDGSPGAAHSAALLDEKVAVAEVALAAAAGVAVDAAADREAVAPGGAWTVETALWDTAATTGGNDAVPVILHGVELVSPAGLELSVDTLPNPERSGFAAFFQPGDEPERGFHLRTLRATPAAGTPSTRPYFLTRPLDGALYDWSNAAPELRGEPFGPAPLAARFRVTVAGVELELEREVVARLRDQAVGEVRRPLRVVPSLEVAVEPDLIVHPLGRGGAAELKVTLTSHSGEALAGHLDLETPEGWSVAGGGPPATFSVAAGGSAEVALHLTPTPELRRGRSALSVRAVVGGAVGGEGMDVRASPRTVHHLAVPLIDYPHVRPTPHPQPAVVEVTAAPIALPHLDAVAYVRGASDRVPELLAQIGLPVRVLSPSELLQADLSGFDAVVVGSRAYEVEPVLAEANPRLLEYVRGGGLMIVQYQQYQFVEGGFAPFELTIDRPHGRVTDERAPVRPLLPDHPALRTPNEIGPQDWEGWVQERGLYFAGSWAGAYTPLLAMRDPDQEEELEGALLVAPVGEGTYVYTGLAFFRQLPAGVSGAYRLLANLLAL